MNAAPANTIVLAAGRADPKNMPTGLFNSMSMVPINGKPIIGWILEEEFKKRPDARIAVVTRQGDKSLQRFIAHFYGTRFPVQLHFVNPAAPEEDTILGSLSAGLEDAVDDSPVNVILGDTLILDPCPTADVIFTSDHVDESKTWCLVETRPSGEIVRFFDKQLVSLERKSAVAGYYAFSSARLLRTAVAQAMAEGGTQLSDALDCYKRQRPLKATPTELWFDFGHVDGMVRAKYALLNTRFFNSLRVDEVRGIIEKKSTNKEKLKDEALWYEQLPPALQIFTPRLLRHWEENGCYHIQQEMYGYPTLAELYLYSDMDLGAWRSALRKVLSVHAQFSAVRGELNQAYFEEIYRGKTWTRLEALAGQSPDWAKLLGCEQIEINGDRYLGLPGLKDKINRQVDALIRSAQATVVHGDYCFSNILFDPSTQFIRTIDPRGRFGERTIYGDPRYDIAKLRHSVVGLYDFIIAGFFQLQQASDCGFECNVFDREITREVSEIFDSLTQEFGYRADEIRLIEAILFLSMVPLHADFPNKQKMLFINGLKLMNEALAENGQ